MTPTGVGVVAGSPQMVLSALLGEAGLSVLTEKQSDQALGGNASSGSEEPIAAQYQACKRCHSVDLASAAAAFHSCAGEQASAVDEWVPVAAVEVAAAADDVAAEPAHTAAVAGSAATAAAPPVSSAEQTHASAPSAPFFPPWTARTVHPAPKTAFSSQAMQPRVHWRSCKLVFAALVV